MDPDNPYARIREATAAERVKIYAEIYDSGPAVRSPGTDKVSAPSARRRRRLALYSKIIGGGHRAIVEIGCGSGDLTCALAELAQRVVGIDMAGAVLGLARERIRQLPANLAQRVQLIKMNAVSLEFAKEVFDCAISTSMIEHLHPDDVDTHLRETWRVLKPGGRYLVWCPNRLGHHKDRPDHLSMMSYAELVDRMRRARFVDFVSPLFTGPPMVDTRLKICWEQALSRAHIGVFWSHLGIRNMLVVARKP